MTASAAKTWRLRPYRPGDEEQLVELFAACFGKPLTVDAWSWKLRQWSDGWAAGVDSVWVAETDDGELIFQYAGIPRTLELPSGPRPVMVAVDGMTHPRFRRRGVLTEGVAAAHDAWRRTGVAAVFGLPNQQWGSRIDAVGWRRIADLTWHLRPLRPERLVARRLQRPVIERLTWLGRLWNRAVSVTGPTEQWRWQRGFSRAKDYSVDGLHFAPVDLPVDAPVGASADGGGSCLRRADSRQDGFLDWRFHRHPEHAYEVAIAIETSGVAGRMISRTDAAGFAFVADLEFADGDAAAVARGRRASSLLAAAAERFRQQGAVAALVLAIDGSQLASAARRAGYRMKWGSFGVYWLPLASDLTDDETAVCELERASLALVGSDFDVV